MTKSDHFQAPGDKHRRMEGSPKANSRVRVFRSSRQDNNLDQESFKEQYKDSSKMKDSLDIAKFQIQEDIRNMKKKNSPNDEIEVISDEETHYLTMMDEENLREASKTFFDNDIHGENN